MCPNDETQGVAKEGAFPPTHWTKLDRIKGAASSERRDLYDFLIRRYWKPVYCFVCRSGRNAQQAEELAADFFAFCFQKNLFAKADRSRGRFRSFLVTTLKNFIANEQRKADAGIRRPKHGFVSIHDLATSEGWHLQLADTETPEDAFIRIWIQELLLHALEALKQECQETGKAVHYEILLARIVRPILEGSEPVSYQELAKQHGLTEKEASTRCTTARRAFERVLRAEIRLYAFSEEEVAAEIRDIFHFVSGSSPA